MSDTCDELRQKLRQVILQRNEVRQLVTEIADLIDPQRYRASQTLARIAVMRRQWAEERRKTSGG